ncbi:MAG TPA: hypothetical protein VGB73_07625, partial [Pyrinomonadaceae bacterium]
AKRAATERIFGFELLPAPLIVSHLQLGLFLQKVGASVSEVGDEREQAQSTFIINHHLKVSKMSINSPLL